jgi:hypothetical protein
MAKIMDNISNLNCTQYWMLLTFKHWQSPSFSYSVSRAINEHYRKNAPCHVAKLCRALPHSKDGFAVRGHNDTRQTHDARQRRRNTHGKEARMAKGLTNARQ